MREAKLLIIEGICYHLLISPCSFELKTAFLASKWFSTTDFEYLIHCNCVSPFMKFTFVMVI